MPMDDAAFEALGRPEVVVLVHPVGASVAEEHRTAEACN
jgi:hypothetical protein